MLRRVGPAQPAWRHATPRSRRWTRARRAIPTSAACRALRALLADYLTGLHARPVAETRIQVTASGMAAVSIALAATVQAGDRVVLHSPAWPNVGNAVRLRGAAVDTTST